MLFTPLALPSLLVAAALVLLLLASTCEGQRQGQEQAQGHEPDFEDEAEMEKLFAKHGFDDFKKRGGVMCHGGMASVQSAAPMESNGCTGADFIQISGQEDFTYCCDIHDACYQTCNVPRKKCDSDFKKCMHNLCDTTFAANSECRSAANMYYTATSLLGASFYEDSQGGHCECKDMRASVVIEHYSGIIESFYKEHAPAEAWGAFDMAKYAAEYKSSVKKWGNLLYHLYKKYEHALLHVQERLNKHDVPRPPAVDKKAEKAGKGKGRGTGEDDEF